MDATQVSSHAVNAPFKCSCGTIWLPQRALIARAVVEFLEAGHCGTAAAVPLTHVQRAVEAWYTKHGRPLPKGLKRALQLCLSNLVKAKIVGHAERVGYWIIP